MTLADTIILLLATIALVGLSAIVIHLKSHERAHCSAIGELQDVLGALGVHVDDATATALPGDVQEFLHYYREHGSTP